MIVIRFSIITFKHPAFGTITTKGNFVDVYKYNVKTEIRYGVPDSVWLHIHQPKETNPKRIQLGVIQEEDLCFVRNLFRFMELTNQHRQHLAVDHTLFLGYLEVDSKPTTSVQPSTVGKWVQTAMEKAGVDRRYKAHSLQSATSTKAVMLGIPIDQVKDHANWSLNSNTFEKFYYRPPRRRLRSTRIQQSIFSNAENSTTILVQLPTKKSIYCFSSAQDSIFDLDLPKLSADTIKTLTMLEDQSCFKFFNTNFPNVYAFVLDTLKINLYQEWPQYSLLRKTQHSFLQALYIWSYKQNTIKVELEHNFFKAAQYILTSYSDKCNRSIQLRTPSERTLWVDRIASIFQTLGDQPGLIGFEWCETLSKSCVDDSINVDLWIKTSRRYLDGLRFDKRHDEILSMEASSGLEKEGMEHGRHA
ncbi:hypothetical protein G6F43_002657 [Rhizopus delemar]|nr:hypothetical protein G6F43_002657 [Rhizopus delemar]